MYISFSKILTCVHTLLLLFVALIFGYSLCFADDCVCLICGWCHTVQGPCPEKFSCGHRRINRLCRMCYRRSEVLHPSPAEFEHGHQIDAKFTYLCVMA